MNKAFTDFRIKSFDAEQGVIKGIASTPTTDRTGDIVEPMGASFRLPLALLHEHDKKAPLGKVIAAKATPAGVEFEAIVAKDATPEVNKVWQQVKAGLIPYVSVGFRSIEAEPTATGHRFKQWEWLELSLTTVPINPEAAIRYVKSIKGASNMSISEQIQQFEAQRADVMKGMDTLVTKGATLTADEDAEYKAGEAELAAIDIHIERLKAAEARQAKSAKPVQGVAHISVESNMPKGAGFVSAMKCMSHAKGHPQYAAELARKNYPDAPEIESYIRTKAAVGAATTTSHAALTTPGALTGEFIGLLNDARIVGRLSGFRNVPHGVKIPRLVTGPSAYVVGEAKPIPLTSTGVDDIEISRFKIAAMAPIANELLALGNPDVDVMFRDAIIEQVASKSDALFIDPTNAGSSIQAAGITYGLAPVASAGVGPQHVRQDVKAALDKFSIANQGTNGAVWIMHSKTASALTFMRTAAGAAAFPGMTIDGGTLLGLPVLVSNSVMGDDVNGYDLVLVKPSEIFRPATLGINVAFSTEASYEALDSGLTQDGAAGTGASLVSAFQNDETLIRVIAFDGWYPRRNPCAVRIAGCKYDEAVIEAIATVAA